MDVYKTESRKVIKRFLRYHLSFGDCIHALYASLGRLIQRMTMKDLPELRAVMLANDEIVMREMKGRRELALPDTHLPPKNSK